MEKVMKKLGKRHIQLGCLDALEVFGRDGHWHTTAYAPLVGHLEVWEIEEKYREPLTVNLPMADVKITDSFQEIRRTSKKYHLIVVDNSMGIYRDDPFSGEAATTHCEHFDLFPDLFRVIEDWAILIVNVIPKTNRAAREKYPELFNPTQLERRGRFYATTHPENVTLREMEEAYRSLAGKNGFDVDWCFFEKRGRKGVAYYLVLKISRQSAVADLETSRVLPSSGAVTKLN